MMCNRTALIFLLYLSMPLFQACLAPFKSEDREPAAEGIWDDNNYERNVQTDCHCGVASSTNVKPWNVFVHIQLGPTEKVICSGTIITSNLILTSHKCLILPKLTDYKVNIYDVWNVKDKEPNVVNMNDVTVSDSIDNNESSKTFTVVDIIYNSHYALYSSVNRHSMNDLVFIKVEPDFTTNSKLKPICLPKYNPKTNIFLQRAMYYGVGGKTDPIREVNLTSGISYTQTCEAELSTPPSDQRLNNSKTICAFHDVTAHPSPEKEGGPLILKSVDSEHTNFIIGIATEVGTQNEDSSIEYTYFTNIMQLIKYIEFQADRHKSTWCVSPPFKLNSIVGGGGKSKRTKIYRPWDDLTEPIVRDETLHCVCGLQSKEQSGRVVGGVTATPYEFGWMSVMRLYMEGREHSSNLCGGSIINDRMILTAAHCVVNDNKIEQKASRVSVLPQNVDATINVHLRTDDPNGINVKLESVIFYPDYAMARKQDFYDYDVALLVLKEPLTFASEGIRPICLPKMGKPITIVGETATVAGWGLVNPYDMTSTSDKLQKIELPVQPLTMCSEIAMSKVTARFVCAGTLNNMKDAAPGDSGGPLMLRDSATKQWTEIGIVSWGEDVMGPSGTKTAAFYTNVQEVLPFIDYHARRVKAKWCKSTP